ncbi:hypothetical protein [Saccharopolyspora pogona]|uniref:hypothetical protein n=1 Tax=Saccharopolyspora pogona TaxID=333966 RepID=UPI001684314F|nr:hypothetical protein [Saccharopolyspora pogona]
MYPFHWVPAGGVRRASTDARSAGLLVYPTGTPVSTLCGLDAVAGTPELIAHVEAERRQRERGGRHRLREPEPESAVPEASTSDGPVMPSLELQRRVLEALRRI